MNNKVLLSSLIVLGIMSISSISYAATPTIKQELGTNIKAEQDFKKLPPNFKGGEHPNFGDFKGNPDFKRPPFPSKEEMQAKKAEIDKRLSLTDAQKKKLEKNKEKDRAKIKPIMEKIDVKKKELHEIYNDTSLTQEQKDKKAESTKKELNKLRVQADDCRKQNMKNFESVLTKDQKTEFEKIKSEQKAEMEKRRAEFEQKKKEFEKQFPPKDGIPKVPPQKK